MLSSLRYFVFLEHCMIHPLHMLLDVVSLPANLSSHSYPRVAKSCFYRDMKQQCCVGVYFHPELDGIPKRFISSSFIAGISFHLPSPHLRFEKRQSFLSHSFSILAVRSISVNKRLRQVLVIQGILTFFVSSKRTKKGTIKAE